MSDFVHLHLHTEHSVLDGLGSPEQYVTKAKELGFTSLACTDHGNVSGAVKFQQACKKEGIKSILGAELYVVPDISVKEKGEKRSHLIVFVKNLTGWNNLLKMITVSNLDGQYYRPRVDPETILRFSEGLIFSSACASSILHHSWGIELFKDLKKKEIDLFLEAMPLKYDEQVKTNILVKELSKELNIPIIGTNDCHYVLKEDKKCQDVLLAIQTKKKWKDPTRWQFNVDDLYLKSRKEMRDSFVEQGCFSPKEIKDILNNTLLIPAMVDFTIPELTTDLPQVPQFTGRDDNNVIRELCEKEFKIKVKTDNDNIYRDRLEEEISLICKQGFARYFIIVWELVDWCEKNDIMVGPGRGSAGGSIICWLLNITKVDPIKFKLIFARFISPARIDLPDIDMDFEDIKRPLVRKHLEETYGEWSVCGVSTFSSLKGRGAIRDVSRVFDVPMVDVSKACESIVVRSGGDARSDYSIEDAFKTFEDGKKFLKKYPEVSRIAMRLESQIRGKGQHAAAIIISSSDLRDGTRCSLERGSKGETITNWDKHDIEHNGLMKLDVLGLNALTVLNQTKKLIKENKGVDINFLEIPLTDKKCFDEFSKGNNTGCFQVGSLGLKRFCQQIGVDDFNMLVHATSLYRPGTLKSGMTTEFVKRKKGEVEWKFQHPIMKKITGDTFGIILYQEQVMMFMYDLGGLGWRTADTVRKVISKSQGSDKFAEFKDLFIEGCRNRKTLDEKTAGQLWDDLASFGSYGFNLSHAVEYSVITYWDQWCKVYYPEEFICASLTYGSENKKDDLVEEALRIGIDVRPPKVGKSHPTMWQIKDGILYTPFIEIKGIGDKTAEGFAELTTKACKEEQEDEKPKKKKAFFKKEDCVEAEKPKKKKAISKRFLKVLDDIGAHDDIPLTDEEAMKLTEYFSYSYLRDKMFKFRNLIDLIKENVDFKSIKAVDFNTINKNYNLFFGTMTEIKFSYRQKVDESKEKGKFNSSGGVYGNLKDDTDSCMLIFGSDIYNKKKEVIEHCAGDFIIVNANVQSRGGSIQCNEAWMQDDMLAGDLKGLGINFLKQKRFSNKEVENCKDCEFCEECEKPFVSTRGRNNIMVISDIPNRDDSTKGEILSGRAGNMIWKFLDDKGFDKKFFNVSSVVKCFPSKSKKAGKKNIKKCSKWLDEEIEKIEPVLIFAIGNASLKYFLDLDSGIMEKSGTTEWSEKHKCWICWSISPNQVLYQEENRELFNKAMLNFSDKIKSLSGK
jgi:DNA polymerase-3 subunit alpha